MTSAAKIAANRANAAKSTGPKTSSGKSHSKINALKFGFYCGGLSISDRDRVEFEALQADLAIQLAPTTALQRLAFEHIVACAWRVKVAIRMETAWLAARPNTLTKSDDAKSGCSEDAPPQWYGTTEGSMRRSIRVLGNLREHISNLGLRHVAEDCVWKEVLVTCFGPDFFELLMRFKDVNIEAIRVARHFVEQSRMFGWEVPFINGSQSQNDRSTSAAPTPDASASLAPQLQLEMVFAIIDLQSQHIKDALRARQQGDGAQMVVRPEFPRYFAEATRDWQRAVDEYVKLKKHRL